MMKATTGGRAYIERQVMKCNGM